MATPPEIVRLKITLNHVKPAVMRRIEVPIVVDLDTLHEMIQVIMPWGNYHGYVFYLRQRETHWGIPPPPEWDMGFPVADSRRTTLARVLSEPGFKVLHYVYDQGDYWRHTIKVERRFWAELWDTFPRLLDVKGRSPPEDVGGPWGYAEYLEAMGDPCHPRHAELLAWRGPFDPAEIDRQAMEVALTAFAKPARRAPRRTARPKVA